VEKLEILPATGRLSGLYTSHSPHIRVDEEAGLALEALRRAESDRW